MLSAHTSLDRWPPRDTHTTAARTQRRTHARTHARRPLPRESCRVACVRECRVKRAPPILSPTATHVRVYTRVLVRPTVQKFITRRRGPPVPHPRTRHGDNANFDGLEGSRAPGISITGRPSFPNYGTRISPLHEASLSCLSIDGSFFLFVIGGGREFLLKCLHSN